jgi:cell division septation protein DedD
MADKNDKGPQIDRKEYMAERMSRLRTAAKDERKYFGELVVDDAPTHGRRMKPVLLLGAVGVVAVGAIIMAVVVFAGGSDAPATRPGQPAGTSPQQSNQNSGSNQPAASVTSLVTATVTPTPSPTETAADHGNEGAVSPSAILKPDDSFSSILLRTPLKGVARVREGFGVARGGDRVHGGIDFAGQSTPFEVLAACDGRVAGVQKSEGFGDYVVIDCGGGWRTIYGQMASIKVKTGDSTRAGETVLGMANAYVHFELRYNGGSVDPTTYITAGDLASTPTPTETPTPTPATTPAAEGTPAPAAEPPTPTPTLGPPTATPVPPTPTAQKAATATPTKRAAPPTPTPKPGVR